MKRREAAVLRARVRDLRKEGLSYRQIGTRLGISGGSVHQYLNTEPGRGAEPDRTYDVMETASAAAARVARELADGKRCTHPGRRGPCSLLLPCADHELTMGLAS